MDKLRIVLVDDHAVLREGLALLIDAQPDMVVVGQASDGREIMPQMLANTADLVVMDVSMPGINGIQATELLRQACPGVHIIALTRHSEPGYVRQLFQAGARGYVLKQAAATELLNAIRDVAAGSTYLDSSLVGRVVHSFVSTHQRGASQTSSLSDRERDVVQLTAYGYSNKEIATQLGLSAKTVDTYKTRAMEKLGLYSRAALVRYALEQGWLEPS